MLHYTYVLLYPALQQPVVVTDESVLVSRWHQPWADPIGRTFQARHQRLQIAQTATGVRFDPFPLPPVVVSVGGFYPPLNEPVRFKKGLGAHLQSTTVIDPQLLTQPEELDEESKWHQPLSEPKRFKRGLAPEQQHVFTTSLFPFTTPYARAYVIT